MAENDSTGNAVDRLTYLIIGAGIGAAVALLFAPKAGRELRGDIKDASRKSIDYTTERARQLGEKATEVYGTTTQKAQELYAQTASKAQDLVEAGKGTIASKKEQLQAAIDAGKEAYAEEKDRLKASGSAGGSGSTGNA
ncbi:MAG TPA: YtxH domain-containing protein [Blastocatellia bacterium]|nr:YtxH domain-containing protein [Blastocatellia bacterium]